jgi:NAD(P)-dependent dehydrogenase (short-subunit alcohol dehydrogenase family)
MSAKRIVFVTGANKHIGYEIVKALLQSDKPYHVYLGSRSLERGQQAVTTLQKECADSPNTVEAVQVDITSDSSIESAFETVKTSRGYIDTLINNAGTYPLFALCTAPNIHQESTQTLATSAARSLCARA